VTADDIIRTLNLEPHPEGGWFRETYRDASSTAIYYLLKRGERSHWHRIRMAEVWHWYAGAALELRIADGAAKSVVVLGSSLHEDQSPQAVVPPNAWQAARSLGDFTLVGCTVAPAFDFAQFEMAPPGWEP
jgi:uncharacterized protein